MADKILIDSNIWVYLFADDDEGKRKISEQYLLDNGLKSAFVISYQIINEVSVVLKKKKFSEPDIRNVINQLTKICVVQDYSKDIALFASELRESHSFSFWDSHIVASGIEAKCTILASEDMQDGQVINGMTIRNIFAV